ncbi:MAG: methyltransferase domain-containing protein [Gemmatimonadaceae bacterium]|nr:methyltransferase domain-containing protein [Gemmatimonadaceae bacterium]MBA3655767.1 methyltransferase domain-containing protein [Gemmatimonadaceae bacterium]
MAEVNLLRSLPVAKRNVNARAATKSADVIQKSREFGELYFDGPRDYGYGGYRYDGRWIPVARDIVRHFDLKAGERILDVGCAKGFLVKDLMTVCPGLEAFGLDISEYALKSCEADVVGRLHLGNAVKLPFPDNSFNAVVSINTLHNLEADLLATALTEMQRLAPGKGFVQVDAYHNEAEREAFLDWVLTAKFHDYPEGWMRMFQRAGYTGDWAWTVV